MLTNQLAKLLKIIHQETAEAFISCCLRARRRQTRRSTAPLSPKPKLWMQEEKLSNSTAQAAAKSYERRSIAPLTPEPNMTEGEQQGEAMMPLKREGEEQGDATQ
eukprot:2904751-Rhodomonas_salina.1